MSDEIEVVVVVDVEGSLVVASTQRPLKLTIINVDDQLLYEPPAEVDEGTTHTEVIEDAVAFIQQVLSEHNKDWVPSEEEDT
jgi:hypothetical protein